MKMKYRSKVETTLIYVREIYGLDRLTLRELFEMQGEAFDWYLRWNPNAFSHLHRTCQPERETYSMSVFSGNLFQQCMRRQMPRIKREKLGGLWNYSLVQPDPRRELPAK